MFKKVGTLCAALVATVAMGFAASPAQAANNDGVGNTYEFVQWWGYNFTQACYDEYYSRPHYAGKVFLSSYWCGGLGVGSGVANNQLSVANYDPSFRVQFCTGTYYSGLCYVARKYPEYVASTNAWYYGNLGSWDLNTESHRFIS